MDVSIAHCLTILFFGLAAGCTPAVSPGSRGADASAAGGKADATSTRPPIGGNRGSGDAGGGGGQGGTEAGTPADGAADIVCDEIEEPPPPHPMPTPEEIAIAGDLHGAYLLMECADKIDDQFCVPKDRATKELPLKFGGDPDTIYNVVLRVWGSVEGITYKNGQMAGKNFYVGGESDTPNYATYGLTAGETTYYLNNFDRGKGTGSHYTYTIDYATPAIPIRGGSLLTLFCRDDDNIFTNNHMDTGPKDPPAGLIPKLAVMPREVDLIGQFVYIEVASIEASP